MSIAIDENKYDPYQEDAFYAQPLTPSNNTQHN